MLFLFSGINNSFYCDKTKAEIEIGQIAVVRVDPVVRVDVVLEGPAENQPLAVYFK